MAMQKPDIRRVIESGKRTEKILYYETISSIPYIIGLLCVLGIVVFLVFSFGDAIDKEFQFQDNVTNSWRGR